MLSSAKLRLRALEPEDVNLLFKWENDYTLWEEGITNVPFSRYELKQYIINVKDIFSDRQYRFMIEDCLSQKAIGTLDLFEFDLMNLRAEVGIYIEKDSRQQGYASEAIELIKKYAFNFLNLKQLYAKICEENIISISLFEKCGFKNNGRLENWMKRGDEWKDCLIFQCLK